MGIVKIGEEAGEDRVKNEIDRMTVTKVHGSKKTCIKTETVI